MITGHAPLVVPGFGHGVAWHLQHQTTQRQVQMASLGLLAASVLPSQLPDELLLPPMGGRVKHPYHVEHGVAAGDHDVQVWTSFAATSDTTMAVARLGLVTLALTASILALGLVLASVVQAHGQPRRRRHGCPAAQSRSQCRTRCRTSQE